MVRRHTGPVPTDVIDVLAAATVGVTSEQALYPVDHVFDGRSGPGGSCWVAGAPGPQRLVVRFQEPHRIGCVTVESEEASESRVQRIQLDVYTGSPSAPALAFEGAPQTFAFSPYRGSFHRAMWTVDVEDATELRLVVDPVPGHHTASLTSLILRRSR